MTEELSRISALASRHRKLGSELEDWNGMGTAWSYDIDPNDEHDAVREAAGLFDMSPLKKIRVRGSDAAKAIDHLFSRDAQKIGEGQSAYGVVLSDAGTICDDAIISCCGTDEWLVVHGSGTSMELLEQSIQGMDVSCQLDDDLHDISLQGPKALAILNAHTPTDLPQLGYFRHVATTLFGHECRISRTGYSGERGYEIFANADVICQIWDEILSNGVMPCSFTALDKVRIEAALLFYGYDMNDTHTPWEVGLGFTINPNKSDFRGKTAVLQSKGQEKFLGAGVSVQHHEALLGGEKIFCKGKEVGVVNSPAFSHRLNQSLALVHIRPDLAKIAGTKLEIIGEDGSYQAQIATIPFLDPQKIKTHE